MREKMTRGSEEMPLVWNSVVCEAPNVFPALVGGVHSIRENSVPSVTLHVSGDCGEC